MFSQFITSLLAQDATAGSCCIEKREKGQAAAARSIQVPALEDVAARVRERDVMPPSAPSELQAGGDASTSACAAAEQSKEQQGERTRRPSKLQAFAQDVFAAGVGALGVLGLHVQPEERKGSKERVLRPEISYEGYEEPSLLALESYYDRIPLGDTAAKSDQDIGMVGNGDTAESATSSDAEEKSTQLQEASHKLLKQLRSAANKKFKNDDAMRRNIQELEKALNELQSQGSVSHRRSGQASTSRSITNTSRDSSSNIESRVLSSNFGDLSPLTAKNRSRPSWVLQVPEPHTPFLSEAQAKSTSVFDSDDDEHVHSKYSYNHINHEKIALICREKGHLMPKESDDERIERLRRSSARPKHMVTQTPYEIQMTNHIEEYKEIMRERFERTKLPLPAKLEEEIAAGGLDVSEVVKRSLSLYHEGSCNAGKYYPGLKPKDGAGDHDLDVDERSRLERYSRDLKVHDVGRLFQSAAASLKRQEPPTISNGPIQP